MDSKDFKLGANYANKELFDKQLIYSIDTSPIIRINNIMSKGILYHDTIEREYYYFIFKSNPEYPEIKINAFRSNLNINENEKYLWIIFPEISKVHKVLDDQAKTSRLFFIKNLYPFPFVIFNNNRIYLFVQYRSDVGVSVTDRILKVKRNYDNLLGTGSMNIESVTNNIFNVVEFLNLFNLKTSIYEIKICVYHPELELQGIGLFKSLSKDYKNNELLLKYKDELRTIKFFDILSPSRLERIFKFASDLFNIKSGFILYHDFRCTGNECVHTIIFEENMKSGIAEVLEKYIDEGIDIRIEEFKKLM